MLSPDPYSLYDFKDIIEVIVCGRNFELLSLILGCQSAVAKVHHCKAIIARNTHLILSLTLIVIPGEFFSDLFAMLAVCNGVPLPMICWCEFRVDCWTCSVDILKRFDLRSKYSEDTLPGTAHATSNSNTGPDDDAIKKALSSDPKLAKLWKKAEQAGFSGKWCCIWYVLVWLLVWSRLSLTNWNCNFFLKIVGDRNRDILPVCHV